MLSRRGFLRSISSIAAAAALPAVVLPARALEVYGRSPCMIDGLPSARSLNGMRSKIAYTLIYGNEEWSPTQFTGFASLVDGVIERAT